MTLITLYDAVTPSGIPRTAGAVGGYSDGLYRWSQADWDSFPGIPHVTITIFGAAGARVVDCEPGCMSPAEAAAWAAGEVQNGRRPTIYSNTSTMPSVRSALAPFGLTLGGQVDWWQAQYDGVAKLEVVDGVMPVAKQYLGSPGNSPGPFDVSVVDPAWLGIEPTPPPPPPSTPGSSSMQTTCEAVRPASVSGVTDAADVFVIAQSDGKLYQRGDSPVWTEGGRALVTPQPPVAPVGVMASWRLDGSALDVYVLGTDGQLYLNAWVNWTYGVWIVIDSDVKLG